MPNENIKNYLKIRSFHFPVIVLSIAVIGVLTYAVFNTNNDMADVLGSKIKNDTVKQQGNSKSSVMIKEVKTINAKQHKAAISQFVDSLENLSAKEGRAGNSKVSQETAEIAASAEEVATDTVEAIDAVESRSAWKTLLLGPDYRNLGQLRSSLAQNTNDLRKLDKSLEGLALQSREQIQAQIMVLNQERQRIYELIETNESKFSLLGWVSRFLTGYTPLSTEEVDESVTDPATGLVITETTPETTL